MWSPVSPHSLSLCILLCSPAFQLHCQSADQLVVGCCGTASQSLKETLKLSGCVSDVAQGENSGSQVDGGVAASATSVRQSWRGGEEKPINGRVVYQLKRFLVTCMKDEHELKNI